MSYKHKYKYNCFLCNTKINSICKCGDTRMYEDKYFCIDLKYCVIYLYKKEYHNFNDIKYSSKLLLKAGNEALRFKINYSFEDVKNLNHLNEIIKKEIKLLNIK